MKVSSTIRSDSERTRTRAKSAPPKRAEHFADMLRIVEEALKEERS